MRRLQPSSNFFAEASLRANKCKWSLATLDLAFTQFLQIPDSKLPLHCHTSPQLLEMGGRLHEAKLLSSYFRARSKCQWRLFHLPLIKLSSNTLMTCSLADMRGGILPKHILFPVRKHCVPLPRKL